MRTNLLAVAMSCLATVVVARAAAPAVPAPAGGAGTALFSKAPVSPTDVRIARRAQELLDAPEKWNRGDVGDCSTDKSKKLTLYCALDRAAREMSGKLDETSAVRQETRAVVSFLSVQEYGIDGFNSDPAISFADVQMFFRVLEDRLARRMAAQNPSARHPASAGESEARPPVAEADLRIVRRAKALIPSPESWNRADTRACPAESRTLSLYCALEQATQEISGSFAHRGAAMQEARFVVDEIAANSGYYGHRLMDFNNDPSTTFFDVQKFFALLEERVVKGLAVEPPKPAPPVSRPGA
jgi:hypothetical protein